MDYPRLCFAIAYIIVDSIYVISSKSVYDEVVKKIQGSSMVDVDGLGYVAVFGAYICMAVSWYVLAGSAVKHWIAENPSTPPYQIGLFIGFVLGLAIYGVFNFTSRLMFKDYDWKIVARDMGWGVSWATLLTALYAVYISRTPRGM